MPCGCRGIESGVLIEPILASETEIRRLGFSLRENAFGLIPVEQNTSSSLGTSVYNELRQRIIDGHLKSGERLREVELASLLGVSRTPIREAIKRLESEGFGTRCVRI